MPSYSEIQALEALLAQPDPAEVEAASNPLDDILAMLSPLVSPDDAAGPMVDASYSAPSYQLRDPRMAPQYLQFGGPQRLTPLQPMRPGQVNGYDRIANQNYQNQLRAQQQFALQQEREQQQAAMAEQRDAELMSRQQADDPPDWILKGLKDKSLRYSPAQLRDRQQMSDAIDKLRADPTWSPAQRARLESRLRERIRQIDLSPQEVPIGERPLTPQQEAAQQTWTDKDSVTGLDIEYQFEVRNGVKSKVPTATGKARIDNWLKEQEHRRRLELEAAKNAAKAQKPVDTPEAKFDRDLKRSEFNARIATFRSEQADNSKKIAAVRERRVEVQSKIQQGLSAGKPDAEAESELKTLLAQEQHLQTEKQDLDDQYKAFVAEARASQAQPAQDDPGADPAMMVDAGMPLDAELGPAGAEEMMQADYEAMQQPPIESENAIWRADGQPLETVGGPVRPGDGAPQLDPMAAKAPIQITSPAELQQRIQAGELREGDIVMTPRGPRPLTAAVIAKLMGGQ